MIYETTSDRAVEEQIARELLQRLPAGFRMTVTPLLDCSDRLITDSSGVVQTVLEIRRRYYPREFFLGASPERGIWLDERKYDRNLARAADLGTTFTFAVRLDDGLFVWQHDPLHDPLPTWETKVVGTNRRSDLNDWAPARVLLLSQFTEIPL